MHVKYVFMFLFDPVMELIPNTIQTIYKCATFRRSFLRPKNVYSNKIQKLIHSCIFVVILLLNPSNINAYCHERFINVEH